MPTHCPIRFKAILQIGQNYSTWCGSDRFCTIFKIKLNKVASGKLPLPEPIDIYISTRMAQLGARYLEISAPHALRAAALPLHHRDPFDRMLIAQVQMENITLVSADLIFQKYSDLSVIWAAN